MVKKQLKKQNSNVKKSTKTTKVVKKEDENYELDIKSIKENSKKVLNFLKKPIVLNTIFILFAFFLAIYVRFGAVDLNATDNWARNSIYNNIQNNIYSSIANSAEFRALPDSMKQQKLTAEVNKYVAQNQEEIDEQVKLMSDQYKEFFKDENGDTYLTAIDSHYYLRRAENLVEKGHVGDVYINNTNYDNLMHGGELSKTEPGIIDYLGLFFYKLNSIFNSNATVLNSVFFVPAIMFAFSVIFAFLIVYYFTKNSFTAFFTSLILGLLPGLIHRTNAGFFDTDFFNILFPLAILYFVLLAFEKKKGKIIYSAIAGLLVGLYNVSWSGSWYFFVLYELAIVMVLGISLFLFLLNKFTKSKKIKSFYSEFIEEDKKKKQSFFNTKYGKAIIVMFFFFLFSFAFMRIFDSNVTLGSMFSLERLTSSTAIKAPTRSGDWPNVYTTVAELNYGSMNQIFSNLQGKGYFFLSMLGLVGLVYYAIKERKYDYLVIFSFLFALISGGIYTTLKGVRFSILLLPGLILAMGFALFFAFKFVKDLVSKIKFENEKTKKTLAYLLPIAFILVGLYLIAPYWNTAMAQRDQTVPSMTDGWHNSLNFIKENSTYEDALIISWWDFGHWFKQYARRPVVFDGASQNSPMAHWTGKILMSDSNISEGILRMLNCGQNNAYDLMLEETNDSAKTIDDLYEILNLSKDDAITYLQSQGYSQETINKVIENSKCEPRRMFIIASEDMVGKSGVWGHFGSWNFDKANIYNYYKKNPRDIDGFIENANRFGYDESQALTTYYKISEMSDQEANTWIVGWPSYFGTESQCTNSMGQLECQNGVSINLNNLSDTLVASEQGYFRPKSIVQYNNETNDLIETNISNDNPYSVGIINRSGTYYTIISEESLAKSLFTKLFFYSHIGKFDNYELLYRDRSITGGRIFVWEIMFD